MEYTGYLDFWFTDRPLPERVRAFAELGIKRVDLWNWRSAPVAEVAAACKAEGVSFNSTFDDKMGSLADPGDNEHTLRSWDESLEMAERFGIEHLFIFSNQVDRQPDGSEWTKRLSRNVTQAEQYANLLRQTELIMRLVEQTRIVVWVEALNEFHIQGGVLVHDHALAADWVQRLDHPQLEMAFDCYHQQRGGGNLIDGLERHFGLYNTFHIGDCPTRNEPGTGEINYANLHRRLVNLGYTGLVGLEFKPSTTEVEALMKTRQIFPDNPVDL